MTDPLPGDETGTGTPRWVKVFGVVALVVVLLFVILMFAGDGRHGPRRHQPSGDTSTPTPTGRP